MNKRTYIESLVKEYHAMLERARNAQKDAQKDANDHKGRLVSRYDTFKEEAQYLTAGQGLRCLELESIIVALEQFLQQCPAVDSNLKTVRAGALVTINNDNQCRVTYLIAPYGGGICLESGQGELWVISKSSPLAKALEGKRAGEKAAYAVGKINRNLSVLAVC